MKNEPAATPRIYAALAAVIAALPAIGRDQQNTQQAYKYRGIEAITAALKPLLAEHKIAVIPTVLSHEQSLRGDKQMPITRMTVRFDFTSLEDGSIVSATTVGEGYDTSDKGSNKAMTAAFKYALMQTLCIADFDDSDAGHSDVGNAQRPQTAMPATNARVCATCGKPAVVFVAGKGRCAECRTKLAGSTAQQTQQRVPVAAPAPAPAPARTPAAAPAPAPAPVSDPFDDEPMDDATLDEVKADVEAWVDAKPQRALTYGEELVDRICMAQTQQALRVIAQEALASYTDGKLSDVEYQRIKTDGANRWRTLEKPQPQSAPQQSADGDDVPASPELQRDIVRRAIVQNATGKNNTGMWLTAKKQDEIDYDNNGKRAIVPFTYIFSKERYARNILHFIEWMEQNPKK